MRLYSGGIANIQNGQQVEAAINLNPVLDSLTEIKIRLDQTRVSAFSNLSSTFVTYPINTSIISTLGWNADTPSELQNIIDSNPNTATTWGRMQGAGNTGHIQIDLGEINKFFIEIKLGISMAPGWNDGEAIWWSTFTESNLNGFPFWSVRNRPTTNEQVGLISEFGIGRYIRVGCTDVGAGQPRLRIYDLKVWKIVNVNT